MGLLQTLCLVKMDTVDGNKQAGAAGKQDQVKTNAADYASSPTAAGAGAAKNSCNSPYSAENNEGKMETEMKGECSILFSKSCILRVENYILNCKVYYFILAKFLFYDIILCHSHVKQIKFLRKGNTKFDLISSYHANYNLT